MPQSAGAGMTRPRATVIVEGIDPAPQGSKTAVMPKDPRDKGKPKHQQRNHPWSRPIMLESSGTRVASYRRALSQAFRNNAPDGCPMVGPVESRMTFVLPRPKAHYRTGKFAALFRDVTPRWRWCWPAGRGDLDKLIRAVHDALKTGRWYGDDVQVCRIVAQVTWCGQDEPARTMVVVTQLEDTDDVLRVRPVMDAANGPPDNSEGNDARG